MKQLIIDLIEILYVARRASMIIRGFRWGRFELVQVGKLVDHRVHTRPPVPVVACQVTR
jgi:hypothetical protein